MTASSNDLAADLMADLARPIEPARQQATRPAARASRPAGLRRAHAVPDRAPAPERAPGTIEATLRLHLREWHLPRIVRSGGSTLLRYGPLDVEF